jgi:hypothetical protein
MRQYDNGLCNEFFSMGRERKSAFCVTVYEHAPICIERKTVYTLCSQNPVPILKLYYIISETEVCSLFQICL